MGYLRVQRGHRCEFTPVLGFSPHSALSWTSCYRGPIKQQRNSDITETPQDPAYSRPVRKRSPGLNSSRENSMFIIYDIIGRAVLGAWPNFLNEINSHVQDLQSGMNLQGSPCISCISGIELNQSRHSLQLHALLLRGRCTPPWRFNSDDVTKRNSCQMVQELLQVSERHIWGQNDLLMWTKRRNEANYHPSPPHTQVRGQATPTAPPLTSPV